MTRIRVKLREPAYRGAPEPEWAEIACGGAGCEHGATWCCECLEEWTVDHEVEMLRTWD